MKVSISELQRHPSLLKQNEVLDIIDKRDKTRVGVFIPKKYERLLEELLEKIERQKRAQKLKKIKSVDEGMDVWDEVSGDGL